MDVSIVVITDKYKRCLKSCLDAFLQHKPAFPCEFIVVNKENNDGTEEMLRRDYPFVKNINLKSPFSISSYRNAGMREAEGRYILHCDADAFFITDAAGRFVRFMERHPDTGLAGGKLIGLDGALQYNCRTFYTWPVIFSRRTPLNRIGGSKEIENRHLMKYRDYNTPQEADWVAGTFFCIRKQALRDIGLLDERFRYGFEDVDYSLRMWKKGWKVMYAPDAIAKHVGFRQSAKLNIWALRHSKSAFLFYLKYKGWGKR